MKNSIFFKYVDTMYTRLNLFVYKHPIATNVTVGILLRGTLIPGLTLANIAHEIVQSATKHDVVSTIRLIMENHFPLHMDYRKMPSVMQNLELRNTLNSHGLFSQMLGKRDVRTFINELPHSYNFYLSGSFQQIWIPEGIQSKYHSGDVLLLDNNSQKVSLVECKTVNQWQKRIPSYFKAHPNIKLSMGSYELNVYDIYIDNCVDDDDLSLNFDELLFKGRDSFFFVQKLDLAYLNNYVNETAHFDLKYSNHINDSFLSKLQKKV